MKKYTTPIFVERLHPSASSTRTEDAENGGKGMKCAKRWRGELRGSFVYTPFQSGLLLFVVVSLVLVE